MKNWLLRIFTLPGVITDESGLASVTLCWGSGCVGDPFLPVYLTENYSNSWVQLCVSEHLPQTSTQYHFWWFCKLTFQGGATFGVWGLTDGGFGPQQSFWTSGGPDFPSETPANSGKSAIFTSNGTKSVCAGFDLPAEFGADLAPLKPVINYM